MVDHKVAGDQRIGKLGVGTQVLQGIAHGRQIDHARHAREVLEDDAGRAIVDVLRDGGGVPLGDVLDVGTLDRRVVLIAQQVLEHDANRVRQAGDRPSPGGLNGVDFVDAVRLVADGESRRSVEGIDR